MHARVAQASLREKEFLIINMEIPEYLTLMKSVSKFAGKIGLNPRGLYKETYNPSTNETKWVISVSWKDNISNSGILCNPKEVDPNTRFRLEFPFIIGTQSEIRGYAKKAEDAGAEYFLKQSIAGDGSVEPSPSFLDLSKVVQVEYAFHEAFHSATKDFLGTEFKHYPIPSKEEACAMIAGHLGAIAYFKGSPLEHEAESNWQKHFNLAKKVNKFHKRLRNLYSCRAKLDGSLIPLEQILEEREEEFSDAKKSFGGELGGPINNAFFLYWDYFYGDITWEYKRLPQFGDIREIVDRLRGK